MPYAGDLFAALFDPQSLTRPVSGTRTHRMNDDITDEAELARVQAQRAAWRLQYLKSSRARKARESAAARIAKRDAKNALR